MGTLNSHSGPTGPLPVSLQGGCRGFWNHRWHDDTEAWERCLSHWARTLTCQRGWIALQSGGVRKLSEQWRVDAEPSKLYGSSLPSWHASFFVRTVSSDCAYLSSPSQENPLGHTWPIKSLLWTLFYFKCFLLHPYINIFKVYFIFKKLFWDAFFW